MVKTSMEKKMEQSYKMAYLSLKQMVQNKLRSNDRLFQDVKNLVGQANLKRRKSVKHIAERYSEPLNALYPVMLMTPESVSAILPLKKKLFDVVIFDEASQLFVERAIPSIYRASRIIVSGDSKQLRPTSVFISRYVDSEDIEDVFEDEMTSESALENQSLLEQSEARYKKTTLLYHYRSEYKELIDFSNAAFYDQRLRFASAATGYIEKPIEIINVEDGLWENKANIAEADRTVKLVKEILMLRESNETLGIITFNSSQRELIQDKLIYEESDDITKEMDRINEKTLEDESLFVKNIENVQGDERDIIIFSIGYARNSSGRVVNQFGTLSQVAGENRLNVAITRAKRKIYVIKSIQSNELRGNNKNQGPIRFKQYLQYVEHLNSNNRESVKILLNQISDTRYQKDEIFFDSPFEEEVYEKLVQVLEKRYLVKTQIEIGSFRIDLGIYDRVKEQYIAGIECDGMTYHSSQKAVENDFYRQQYLESRGWRILRIWSTNWWRDRDEEIRVILQKLRDIEKIVDR
jgi:very-short-patch-repair endonuclease